MAQLHMSSRASSSLSRLSTQKQQPCCAVLPGRAAPNSRQTNVVAQAQASSRLGHAAVLRAGAAAKRQRRSVVVQVGVFSVMAGWEKLWVDVCVLISRGCCWQAASRGLGDSSTAAAAAEQLTLFCQSQQLPASVTNVDTFVIINSRVWDPAGLESSYAALGFFPFDLPAANSNSEETTLQQLAMIRSFSVGSFYTAALSNCMVVRSCGWLLACEA